MVSYAVHGFGKKLAGNGDLKRKSIQDFVEEAMKYLDKIRKYYETGHSQPNRAWVSMPH